LREKALALYVGGLIALPRLLRN